MQQILMMLGAAVTFLAAVAADAASLRQDVVATGEELTLGDLFADLPAEQASVAVARAPAAGRTVTLDSAWLTRVARAYAVDWTPARTDGPVSIRRASPDELAAVTDAMREELSRYIDTRAVPSTAAPAPAAAIEQAQTPAAAAAEPAQPSVATVDVPVLRRRLRRGEIIEATDLDWLTVAETRRLTAAAMSIDELVGMSARRALRAGEPVPLGDLRAPIAVLRGDAVAMVMRSGPMTLTARGRAIEDGAVGDVIRVMNSDSSRTIHAVVTGANSVQVGLGAFAVGRN